MFTADPLARRGRHHAGHLAKTNPIYLDGRSQHARWLDKVVLVQGILAKTKSSQEFIVGCDARGETAVESIPGTATWSHPLPLALLEWMERG
jgi:hypothetical protein